MSSTPPTTLDCKLDVTGVSAPSPCSPSRFHLDLFSGIGGFALAARWNGLTTRAFVEKDNYAQKVLRKNFAGIPIYDDICNFDGKPYAGTWLLTGGFPCQPYSLAGKRAGASDDRALWPQMLRVIDESKPQWVLGENVPGIVNMELDRVLSDLECLGYSCWSLIIPALACDARHRRDRVWIMANSKSGQSGQPSEWQGRESAGGRSANLGGSANSRRETLPDANGARCEEQRCAVADGQEHETAECGNRWEAEPAVGRVVDGLPSRVDRLKGLGNAIVPQVAAQLIREMVKMENAPHE